MAAASKRCTTTSGYLQVWPGMLWKVAWGSGHKSKPAACKLASTSAVQSQLEQMPRRGAAYMRVCRLFTKASACLGSSIFSSLQLFNVCYCSAPSVHNLQCLATHMDRLPMHTEDCRHARAAVRHHSTCQPDVPADGGREVGVELNGQRIMAPLGAVLYIARAEVQSTLQAAG